MKEPDQYRQRMDNVKVYTHTYTEEEEDTWHTYFTIATLINREDFAFIHLRNASFIEFWGGGCSDRSGKTGENDKSSSGEDAHGDYVRDYRGNEGVNEHICISLIGSRLPSDRVGKERVPLHRPVTVLINTVKHYRSSIPFLVGTGGIFI